MAGNSTSEIGTNSSLKLPWCKLAYWELQNRIGQMFEVNSTRIDVFANYPHGNGFCLNEIAREPPSNHNYNPFSHRNDKMVKSHKQSSQKDAVIKTRDKIGCGVTICREENGVRVYNKSNYAIFVNSPTLDPPNTRNLTVFKVLPGSSIKAFDYETAKMYKRVQTFGPIDLNSFRISFVKGWGPGYSRQLITCCPCWLEVLLVIMR